MAAANAVYSFCFERGLRLTVTSRNAVPLLPMQLAKSFAERTACPVLRYLADAQFLGLAGLWKKLCQGQLPARCTKQWCGAAYKPVSRLHTSQTVGRSIILLVGCQFSQRVREPDSQPVVSQSAIRPVVTLPEERLRGVHRQEGPNLA